MPDPARLKSAGIRRLRGEPRQCGQQHWLRGEPRQCGLKAPGFVAFGGSRGSAGIGRIAWLRRPWLQQANAGHPWPACTRSPDHRVFRHLKVRGFVEAGSGTPHRSGERHDREGRRCKGISSERYMDVPRPRVGAGRGTTRRTKSPCSGGPRPKRSFCPCSGGPCPKRSFCPCSGGPRPKSSTAAERLLTQCLCSGLAGADPCPAQLGEAPSFCTAIAYPWRTTPRERP